MVHKVGYEGFHRITINTNTSLGVCSYDQNKYQRAAVHHKFQYGTTLYRVCIFRTAVQYSSSTTAKSVWYKKEQ